LEINQRGMGQFLEKGESTLIFLGNKTKFPQETVGDK
jgi:hypothetical protein